MRDRPDLQLQLPTLETWQQRLLAGLFGVYVLELVLSNSPLPLASLYWWPLGQGFQPWQPLTRFFVQGASADGVTSVLFSLVVLYFFLPAMASMFARRDLGAATLSAAAVGTLLPMAADLAGLVGFGAPALGWSPLTLVLPVLLGLHRPDADILLLIFPVKARWFLWGVLVVGLLQLLAQRSLVTWQGIGVWLGAVGWYHLLGPGSRRRDLRARASSIEKELSRFQVLEGGRGPRSKGDDTVH